MFFYDLRSSYYQLSLIREFHNVKTGGILYTQFACLGFLLIMESQRNLHNKTLMTKQLMHTYSQIEFYSSRKLFSGSFNGVTYEICTYSIKKIIIIEKDRIWANVKNIKLFLKVIHGSISYLYVQLHTSPQKFIVSIPGFFSSCPICPACQSPSEWQHNHLVHNLLIPILHCLKSSLSWSIVIQSCKLPCSFGSTNQ